MVEPDAFFAGIYASKFAQERLGLEVAESFAAARKILCRKTPRAVLLEMAPNVEESVAFIAELRAQPKSFAVPIVVLTNLGDVETIKRAFAAGASEYLLKAHFVPVETVRKVKKIVGA
jgi:DNA-binding response OmpR family regulator